MTSAMRQIALAALLSLAPMVGMAGDYVNKNEANVAIEGYDAVAYHTAGRPMQGDPSISHEWHDAIWLFASADNRALFVADPDRYAPQFGGFCSGAMSKGIVATIDPQEWVIVDGQLFLGGRPGAVDYVRTGQQERLADAAANYRALNPVD